MKLLAVLLLSALLVPEPPAPTSAVPAKAASTPQASTSLTLPDTGLDLVLRWRQLPRDLSPFLEPEGLDAWGLKALRVRSLLAQGAELDNDVNLRAGDALLPPGRWKLGFTVPPGGGPRFFAVVGQEALDLPSLAVEPGFDAPALLLQWVFIDRAKVQLHWHVGRRAGTVDFALGAEGSAEQR
ncbi:MAG: hypothetical protein FJ296_09530, partial [Planctomycetes bacterium]|nr:hypothetical protein [Planctomycetota bacterium]